MRALLGLVLAMGLSFACGAGGTDEAGSTANAVTKASTQGLLDVNDVSLLLPLAVRGTKGTLTPDIPLRGTSVVHELLTQAALDGLFDHLNRAPAAQCQAQGTKPEDCPPGFVARAADAQIDAWRVAAVRFDPCAPGLAAVRAGANDGNCAVQLRLVAQPLGNDLTSGPPDLAAHLVFTLGLVPAASVAKAPLVRAMVKDLVDLKNAGRGATAGAPLGVHPGLAKNLGAQKVEALIAKYTVAPVDYQLAFIGLHDLPSAPEPWYFTVGKIGSDAAGNARSSFTPLAQLPMMPPATTVQVFAPLGSFVPVVSNPASIAPLTTTTLVRETSIDASAAKTPFEIEDPHVTSFFTTDCASCHSSSSMTFAVGVDGRIFGDGPELAARMKIPRNITGYIATGNLQSNPQFLRNFGYTSNDEQPVRGKPLPALVRGTISDRTLNETIEIVEFINTEVLLPTPPSAAAPVGPGLFCGNDDSKVWKCLREGSPRCLAACTRPK